MTNFLKVTLLILLVDVIKCARIDDLTLLQFVSIGTHTCVHYRIQQLKQDYSVKISTMTEMFYTVHNGTTVCMWLLSIGNTDSMTKELIFFY